MSEQPQQEMLPVDEAIKVIEYTTIYKTNKWWEAVVLGNMFGHDKIMIFLWQWNDKTGKWKRKQKMGVNFEKDWEALKSAIEKYLPRIKAVTA